MRKSGIPAIGDAPWGTHVCLFYHTKDDLLDILVPYFKAGLENNEFCMWVTSEPLSAEEARGALGSAVSDLDGYVQKGQIEILDYTHWYTRSGRFDADEVLRGWAEKEQQALERGFDGLRFTGNTFWLEKKDWGRFAEYEAKVDSVINAHRMMAVCTYSLERCGAAEIMDVMSNHESALVRRQGRWDIVKSARRSEAVEGLRESEERFRTVFDAGPVGMCLTTPSGHFLRVNQAFADFLGYDPAELRGMHFLDITHPDDRPASDERVRRTLGGATQRFSLEKRYLRKDGQVVWGIVSAHLLRDDQERPLFFITHLQDITARKRAEEELRQLPARLLNAQEEERRRIAKELHDSTAQELAAAIMGMGTLQRQLAGVEGPAQETLADALALLEKSARDVRTLSHLLHPPMMDELSVADALRHYVAGFSQRSGIKVAVELPQGQLPLAEEARVALLRIVQEALSNIHRHSASATARVRLARKGAEAVLEIADDGCGIPAPGGTGPQALLGVGLASMRERARALGGRVEVQTGPAGTLIRAVVPLAEEQDA
ncbi:MAG TPA: MEDS domain-containing protein [Planctomycetota bacterium]|nr:MEDS domain-containing protein [Planctomycetota bacterium]